AGASPRGCAPARPVTSGLARAPLPGEVVDGADVAVGGVHGHEADLVRGRGARVQPQFGVDVEVALHSAGRPDQLGPVGGVRGLPVVVVGAGVVVGAEL